MRFKASLRLDTLPILLGKIIFWKDATASLARLARTGGATGGGSSSSCLSASSSCSYLKLTPTHFFLNVRHAGALEAYLEADATAFFYGGFTIESKRNNNIALLLEVQHLYDALRLAAQCTRITVKLAKRQNQGVLSFEFTDALMDNLWITQWNVETPRLRLALGALARLRRLRTDEVVLDVDTTLDREGFCTISLSGEPPSEARIARIFKTRRLAAALKVALEVSRGKPSEGLVACIIPEDESAHPWACILFHSSKLESLKLFCVLPTVRHASRGAALE